MENITLRQFQKGDTKALINIIRDTWHYDEFCSPATACKLAEIFLYSCLANQTYTQVALQNRQPAGVIMGKNIQKWKCPVRYRIKQILAVISLLLSAEGRKVSGIFRGVKDIDDQLLNRSKTNYQGELSFFAVSASARGKGIGKRLFQNFLDYMKSQNISEFYLFTDTSCNYGFYEHQGMRRQGKKEKEFIVNGNMEKMEFYLYCNARSASAHRT